MTFRELVLFFISSTTRFISPTEVATEWALAVIAALAIFFLPWNPAGWLKPVLATLRKFAARKRTAILICGMLPALLRLSMLGFFPVPDPSIHDEFSHLLLGDTLAHGRLTNPTHPMWAHFESIHIIQRPTYNSMYPPGQGAFLALGEVLFHEPWAGVVLSVSLMFAAMCWMMQGWLPPEWAFYGTLIAILKFGVTTPWMNSYLGGAVPGIGGALLIGALPRLKCNPRRVRLALWLGLGVVILMNTRPFEGAVLTLAASAYLMGGFLRNRRHKFIMRLLIPAAIVLSVGVLLTGVYCWKVTGSPFRMPYQVNRDTYGWPENLAFLSPKKIQLQHSVLQDMYSKEIHNRDAYSTLPKIQDSLNLRIFENWTFFIGPVLTLPLIFLPWVFQDRQTRPLFYFLAAIAILNVFQLVLYPYHLGPVVCIVFAIVAQATRFLYIRLLSYRRPSALYFSMLLPVCLILASALKQQAAELGLPLAYWESATELHRDQRAYLQSWLTARPGKHLVIVRYGSSHPVNQEWVYNGADIDGSKVVWAREMDSSSDASLLKYFSDRDVWLLQADVYPQRLIRYPGPPAESEAGAAGSKPVCTTAIDRR